MLIKGHFKIKMLNPRGLSENLNLYSAKETSLVAQTVKASTYNAGEPGSIPGLGRSPWRRKWHPTPVLLPGKSHGRTEEPGRLQSMGSQRVGHN